MSRAILLEGYLLELISSSSNSSSPWIQTRPIHTHKIILKLVLPILDKSIYITVLCHTTIKKETKENSDEVYLLHGKV